MGKKSRGRARRGIVQSEIPDDPVKASELSERFCSFKRDEQTVYVIVREVDELTRAVCSNSNVRLGLNCPSVL